MKPKKENTKQAHKRSATNPVTCHLSPVTYFVDGKKKIINAKILTSIPAKALGLMFQKNSPPLLFVSRRFQWNPITSYFCKPFKAIWLDDKFHSTKVIEVKTWKFNISGHGKYLLEIPFTTKKDKLSSTRFTIGNRNI